MAEPERKVAVIEYKTQKRSIGFRVGIKRPRYNMGSPVAGTSAQSRKNSIERSQMIFRVEIHYGSQFSVAMSI